MRDPRDVMKQKIEEYERVLKEIEALRIAIPLLEEPKPKPEGEPANATDRALHT